MQYNKNQQCIIRILKWVQTIQDVFNKFSVQVYDDFEREEICQLAVNQLITNIYELAKKIDGDIVDKMPLLSKSRLSLKTARNISSHDYDSLDVKIIYRLVNDLTNIDFKRELEAMCNELKQNAPNV